MRDFVVGCPLAAAALRWCRVLPDRWVMPHHAIRASFRLGTWAARSTVSVRYSALWPASWIGVADRSRTSKSAEVRRIWEVYDEHRKHVPRMCGEYRVLHRIGTFSLGCVATKVPIATHPPFFVKVRCVT